MERKAKLLTRDIKVRRIINAVCQRQRISKPKLMSRDRHWVIVWPRFLAIAMIYEHVPCRQLDIAKLFGVSQPAIDNALQTVADLASISKHARSDVEVLREWIVNL